jgi:hypothetical protein
LHAPSLAHPGSNLAALTKNFVVGAVRLADFVTEGLPHRNGPFGAICEILARTLPREVDVAGFKNFRRRLSAALLIAVGLLGSERPASATPFSTTDVEVGTSSWPGWWRVAIANDSVLVGSRNQNRARLHTKSGASYPLTTTFVPTVSGVGTEFGSSVALSGDRAFVGASLDLNPDGVATGSVYVFQRTGSTWTQSAKLFPSSGIQAGRFGTSVAISGNRLVVGSSFEGHAYVYELIANAWQQTAQLASSGYFYGNSVAIDGNRVATGSASGVALFDCIQSGCSQTALLKPGAPYEMVKGFGTSLAISPDLIVVGAPDNPDGLHEAHSRVFVYQRSGSNWIQTTSWTETTPLDALGFGESLALSDTHLVVGAPVHSDFIGPGSGILYVYNRQGTNFALREKITDQTNFFAIEFGSSVALNGTRLGAGHGLHNEADPFSSVGTGTVKVIELTAPPATPAPAGAPFAVLTLASMLGALGVAIAGRGLSSPAAPRRRRL